MSEPIGMGVVGAGAIGIRAALRHLSQEDVQDRVRLAAVCDPAPGRAEAAAEEYGVAAHYTTLEELLDDPSVDAVTICSPIGLHYDQGMAALRAGKHIHFNKTMTTRANEADDLIALAEEKNLHIVASPGQMLHPANQRVRKHLLQGDIGQLMWATAGAAIDTYHMDEEFRGGDTPLTNVDPTWYFRKPGGGPLYDVTVYSLHTLTGILGPAKRVTAMSGLAVPVRQSRSGPIDADMDDTTLMLLDFGNALFGFVYGTVAGGVTEGFNPSFFGLKGSIVGQRLGDRSLAEEGDHEPHVVGPHKGLAESHVFEDMMQLVDWVRDGTPSIASAEHARHVIDIFEASYRSAETGQAQDLRTTFEPIALEDL